MIYTNLDVNKMADELKNRFNNITNEKFIKASIDYHYEIGLITKDERDELKRIFLTTQDESIKDILNDITAVISKINKQQEEHFIEDLDYIKLDLERTINNQEDRRCEVL